MSGASALMSRDRALHQIRDEMRVAAVDVREVGDRESAFHALSIERKSKQPGVRHDWYRGLRWHWKRLISRHIRVKELHASSTRRSSSTPRSSITTEYRGSTSPIRSCSQRAEDGRVIEAFTPDFYLPEQDLYLEVTVMKQSLVTRKNRKLRKLRELYPDVQDQAVLRARLREDRVALRPAQGVVSSRPETDADRRGVPRRGGDRRARARARRRDRAGLRRPRAAARRVAQGLRPVRHRPLAGDADRPRARLRRALGLRLGRARRARADPLPQGSRPRDRRPRRGHRRRGRRHRADAQLPLPDASRCGSPSRSSPRCSSTGPTGGSSTTCRSATSASPSPTSSSPATASISTSAGATCPTCTWSN